MPYEYSPADDERFMCEALAEARAAAELGEVPIGAVVARTGEIVARAHNRRELNQDPSAHAEFSAIVAAAQALGRWRLDDCTVYVTLEPCTMCAGLMVNARVGRCVFGARDPKAGGMGSLYQLNADARLNHEFPATGGVLADECSELLRSFFAERRAQRGGPAKAGSEHHAKPADAIHAELARTQAQERTAAGDRAPYPAQTTPSPQAPLRVLIAIDSFKGSASSAQAAAWIEEGIRRVAPGARITCIPMADGGEGTVAAVRAARGGSPCTHEVAGPFGTRVQADYLLVPGSAPTAVIETASAAGIGFSARTEADALQASTAGVGELVLDAAKNGAALVYLGLGGSCTNDGGAGFLQALGARILDATGAPCAPGLAGLASTASIDLAPALERLGKTELIALTDVTNPLVGRKGALAVFGPQKGLAHPAEHDRAMIAYSRLLDDAAARAGISAPHLAGVPGAGAAGGLGAAVLALGGQLVSGAEAILDLARFDEAATTADLVITGEGHMDAQTAHGKAPAIVAQRARRCGAPVIAIVGGRESDLDVVYKQGIDLVITAPREPMPPEQALTAEETRTNLICAGESAARAFLLGQRAQHR